MNISRLLIANMSPLATTMLLGLVAPNLSTANERVQSYDNGIQYDYLEFRIVDYETDFGVEGDGFSLGGSFLLNDELYVLGRYSTVDIDNFADVDLTQLAVGGGVILPQDKFDLSAQFQLLSYDVDPGGSENGFQLTFAARSLIQSDLEVFGSFNYLDIEDSDTFLQFGFDYYLSDEFSAGVSFDIMGDADQFAVGVRYHFK